jgi:hypothetical protein
MGKRPWRSKTFFVNLGAILALKFAYAFVPGSREFFCGNSDLLFQLLCAVNLYLRTITKEPITMRSDPTLIKLILVGLILTSCTPYKVRFDGAPAPIDMNRHTVLLSTDCGGVTRYGYGQAGCSFGDGDALDGGLTVYTPLPGTIWFYSRGCGIDDKYMIPEEHKPYYVPMAELFKKVPETVTSCMVSIYVAWQLPAGVTSEYPLRGMTGRFYFRRRAKGQSPGAMAWGEGEASKGVQFAQFRGSGRGEPLTLNVTTSAPAQHGKYRLFGCGSGVPSGEYTGSSFTVPRDTMITSQPKPGGCVLFGFAAGETSIDDLVVGTEVFDIREVKLSASVTLDGKGNVCWLTEESVSLVVYNGKWSNDLTGCFPVAQDSQAIGFFTHVGRAHYALVHDGKVEDIE